MTRWEVTERLLDVRGVPDGLEAWRLDQVVDDDIGRRVVGSRTGLQPVRRLVLRGRGMAPTGLTHAEVARHLSTGTRRRSSATRPDAVAHALARAGLVELVCERADGVDLVCGSWRQWRRTNLGEQLDEGYREPLDPDDVIEAASRDVAGAVVVDDVDVAGHWRRVSAAALAEMVDIRDRTGRLRDDGSLRGMPRSVAARHLVGDTHALDDGALARPHARVVVAQLGGAESDPREALDAAGILTHSAIATVACHGVPARGDGVAARLLSAAGDHVQVLLAAHLSVDPDPVAPPSGPGWLFCVENQALVQWAAEHDLGVPVVAMTTTAGRMLTAAAARAGWTVAVTGDFEWGGLAAAAATLRAVPSAVAWRLSADDYMAAVKAGRTSGQPLSGRAVASPWSPELSQAMATHRLRVTEEDRFEDLVHDLAAGRPTEHPGRA